MKTNHQWTRIGTRTDGPPSTTTGAKMLLHFCPVGVTLSWEEAHPGARASRPHKSSRSFGHLLHRNQPAAAPCLCFGRAHAVPAGRAVGCNIAGKLSGNRRDSMRAGRPRSRGLSSRWRGGGYPAGDFSESRPVPFGKLPFACEPGARPPRLGRSIEKDYKLNIDAQDAQDNQDGTLLHQRLTLAMIARGFVDSLDDKSAVSRKNPVHPVHRCESEIHPCSTPGPDVGIVGRNYLSFWADGTSIGDGNLVSETGHQPLITVHYSLFRAAAPHDGDGS